ncbi:hypothetical protein G6F35_018518 [Rhizopus arrhizus]|nr:hypothetical protein G6F35_018518 [Rhizopus arrhizus]
MRVIRPMPSRYIRVIVADDHPAVALGISYELGLDPAIDVIGCAKNSTDLVAQLEVQPCDVLVSDYTMPGAAYRGPDHDRYPDTDPGLAGARQRLRIEQV